MPDWRHVTGSTRIVAEAYNEEEEKIYVRFHDGAEWVYEDCPMSVWEDFTAPGQSRGKFINEVLDHKPHGEFFG